ncbi:hypothetical protein M3Y98_00000900 [Aphelenchoides besseyi]|nr:hypothetical protein M3Y98_00000900 [Aphelenchoides besseyi]KAI6198431.1 hypothetical protein M3Y96_00518600 [Aphelenchoides besseyi]
MSTCGLEYQWSCNLSASKEFWESKGRTIETKLFFGDNEFTFTVESRANKWANFKVTNERGSDLICFAWAEQNGKFIGGSKDRPIELNEWQLVQNDCKTFTIVSRIIVKKKEAQKSLKTKLNNKIGEQKLTAQILEEMQPINGNTHRSG